MDARPLLPLLYQLRHWPSFASESQRPRVESKQNEVNAGASSGGAREDGLAMRATLRGRQPAAAPPSASNAAAAPYANGAPSTKASLRRTRLTREFQRRWSLLSVPSRRAAAAGGVLLLGLLAVSFLDLLLYSDRSDETPARSVETEFSVIINTYKRPAMLAEAVRHYAGRCGRGAGVGQVFIIWAEQDTAPPDPAVFFNPSGYLKGSTTDTGDVDPNQADVQILRVPNSLNSRFLPIPQMTTTALFMVDDDVRVDCASLARGFRAWRSHPDAMVGYYPRLASPPRGTTAESHGYIEHCWPIVFLRQRANFVLTKASFLHRQYLDLYSSADHPQAIRDYVDRYMNCEDIAMSLLVANVTRSKDPRSQRRPAPPIYVEGRIADRGLFSGISTGSGFVARRAQCLTDLSRFYEPPGGGGGVGGGDAGGAALFGHTFDLAEVAWARHAPGFWWQHRPSNPFEWGALLDFFQ